MSRISKIKEPIKEELEEFSVFFKRTMKSKVSLLDIISNYLIKKRGKQLRPIFVFLTAKLCGETHHNTYVAAGLIELLHTATLVHDDVVDNSNLRRGFFSIKALWKSKVAVLIGDYLLSKGLLLAVENKAYDLLEIVSNAVKEMAEGELIQIEKSRSLNIEEEIYFKIIKKKTATLIAASTACGAKSVGADDAVENMLELGINIGIAFQIKDDLFDYQSKSIIGKPYGNDIQEKKMTLPLIYALKYSNKNDKRKILQIIRKKHKTKQQVQEIIKFVTKYDGITYSINKMNEYKDNALSILNNYKDSPAKKSLKELFNFIIERKK